MDPYEFDDRTARIKKKRKSGVHDAVCVMEIGGNRTGSRIPVSLDTVLERHIAFQRVKFPFLAPSQIKGRTLKALGLPNCMGDFPRTPSKGKPAWLQSPNLEVNKLAMLNYSKLLRNFVSKTPGPREQQLNLSFCSQNDILISEVSCDTEDRIIQRVKKCVAVDPVEKFHLPLLGSKARKKVFSPLPRKTVAAAHQSLSVTQSLGDRAHLEESESDYEIELFAEHRAKQPTAAFGENWNSEEFRFSNVDSDSEYSKSNLSEQEPNTMQEDGASLVQSGLDRPETAGTKTSAVSTTGEFEAIRSCYTPKPLTLHHKNIKNTSIKFQKKKKESSASNISLDTDDSSDMFEQRRSTRQQKQAPLALIRCFSGTKTKFKKNLNVRESTVSDSVSEADLSDVGIFKTPKLRSVKRNKYSVKHQAKEKMHSKQPAGLNVTSKADNSSVSMEDDGPLQHKQKGQNQNLLTSSGKLVSDKKVAMNLKSKESSTAGTESDTDNSEAGLFVTPKLSTKHTSDVVSDKKVTTNPQSKESSTAGTESDTDNSETGLFVTPKLCTKRTSDFSKPSATSNETESANNLLLNEHVEAPPEQPESSQIPDLTNTHELGWSKNIAPIMAIKTKKNNAESTNKNSNKSKLKLHKHKALHNLKTINYPLVLKNIASLNNTFESKSDEDTTEAAGDAQWSTDIVGVGSQQVSSVSESVSCSDKENAWQELLYKGRHTEQEIERHNSAVNLEMEYFCESSDFETEYEPKLNSGKNPTPPYKQNDWRKDKNVKSRESPETLEISIDPDIKSEAPEVFLKSLNAYSKASRTPETLNFETEDENDADIVANELQSESDGEFETTLEYLPAKQIAYAVWRKDENAKRRQSPETLDISFDTNTNNKPSPNLSNIKSNLCSPEREESAAEDDHSQFQNETSQKSRASLESEAQVNRVSAIWTKINPTLKSPDFNLYYSSDSEPNNKNKSKEKLGRKISEGVASETWNSPAPSASSEDLSAEAGNKKDRKKKKQMRLKVSAGVNASETTESLAPGTLSEDLSAETGSKKGRKKNKQMKLKVSAGVNASESSNSQAPGTLSEDKSANKIGSETRKKIRCKISEGVSNSEADGSFALPSDEIGIAEIENKPTPAKEGTAKLPAKGLKRSLVDIASPRKKTNIDQSSGKLEVPAKSLLKVGNKFSNVIPTPPLKNKRKRSIATPDSLKSELSDASDQEESKFSKVISTPQPKKKKIIAVASPESEQSDDSVQSDVSDQEESIKFSKVISTPQPKKKKTKAAASPESEQSDSSEQSDVSDQSYHTENAFSKVLPTPQPKKKKTKAAVTVESEQSSSEETANECNENESKNVQSDSESISVDSDKSASNFSSLILSPKTTKNKSLQSERNENSGDSGDGYEMESLFSRVVSKPKKKSSNFVAPPMSCQSGDTGKDTLVIHRYQTRYTGSVERVSLNLPSINPAMKVTKFLSALGDNSQESYLSSPNNASCSQDKVEVASCKEEESEAENAQGSVSYVASECSNRSYLLGLFQSPRHTSPSSMLGQCGASQLLTLQPLVCLQAVEAPHSYAAADFWRWGQL